MADPSDLTQRQSAPPEADEKVNILIVDDRPDKIIALESVLAELGQNVVEAHSGKDALRLLLKHEFAVILLDVSMPVMDGFETASLIRQRQNSEHTPIIFVSAINATETHASRGYSLGAVDYIFAPVVPEVLRAKVNVFIDLFKKTQQVKRQGDWLRAEAERRAARLESRLHTLLNRLNVGVFRATYDGRILEANPTFFRLLGLDPASNANSANVNIREFYLDPRERDRMLAELTVNGQAQEHNVQMRRKDRELIWVRVSKSLTFEPGKDRVVEGLLEDISERKHAEEVLVTKVEELARTNAELEQFAYIASHDLQEPLRMVSSFSSLLQRRYGEQFDEQGKQYISTLVESSGRMQTLIRDILALSRVGKIESPATFDGSDVLAKALFNLQSMVEETHAQITADALPSINGDAVLIGQVFQNIIGNAMKFHGKDAPRVRISVKACQGGWQISIADNGIGISPEHQDKIFGIFQRLHTRAEYPGTGIGLAFCRKVIEHHGGRIWVESNPGGGSIFHFTLGESGAMAARPHEPSLTETGT
ncbi:MAG: response regulator [Planctomycetes bacterium]|nr:response regulator [Planctomycetota bacterium]